MSSFFDVIADEDDQLPSPAQTRWSANAHASSSRDRESSIVSSSSLDGNGSRSFLSRLESTISPNGKTDRYTSVGIESVLGEDIDDGLGGRGIGGKELELGLDGEEDDDLDDVNRMGRVWVRERGTTGIMRWEGDLIDNLLDKLEQQQKMVNTLRSDPQTSEEEHFKLMLVQTEMERVKFLVRSYVRTRLHKIERYAHYVVLTPNLHSLLSGAELSHAKRYTELLNTHFQHSVLDSLPEWLRKMDDSYGDGLSMVSKPNKNIPVLIYCRKDCGEITLEGGERAALAKGTTHLVKYKLVERWIDLGRAEVL